MTQAVHFLLGSLNGDPGRTLFYWEVSTVTQAVHFTVLESLNGDPGRTLFTGKSNGDPGRTLYCTGKSNGDPGRTLQESSELITSGLSQRFTQAVHCLGSCVTDTNNLCISIQINRALPWVHHEEENPKNQLLILIAQKIKSPRPV